MSIKKKSTVRSAINSTFPTGTPGGIKAADHRLFLDDEVDSAIYGKQFIIGRDLASATEQYYRLGTLTSSANFQGTITVQTVGSAVNGNSTTIIDVSVRASSALAPKATFTLRNESHSGDGLLTDIRAVALSAVTSPDVAIDIQLTGTATVSGTVFVNIIDTSEVSDGVTTFTPDTDMTEVAAAISSPESLVTASLFAASIAGQDEVEIRQSSDLDALATNSVITVGDGETLTVNVEIQFLVTSVRFELEGSGQLRFVSLLADPIYIYTGTATFISGNVGRLSFNNITMFSVTGVTQFLDITGFGTINIFDTALIGWDDLGTLLNNRGLIVRFTSIIDFTTGFDLINTGLTALDCLFSSSTMATNACIRISGNKSNPNKADGLFMNVPSNAALLEFDAGVPDASRLLADNNQIVNGSLFLTNGTTGTFSAAAQGPKATTQTVTSVEAGTAVGPENNAQFNFTNVDLVANIAVDLASFGFDGYDISNGKVILVDANSFEVEGLFFETGETAGGTLTYDTTILTSTNTLSNGVTLTVDTTGDTTYDGGTTIFNASGSVFSINRPFDGSEAGTWNTSSLDETDIKVISSDNPDSTDSKYIACGFMSGNTTATDITGTIYQDFNLPTFAPSSNIERWKVITATNGLFEYTGNEPFDGSINFTISISKGGGGSSRYNLKYVRSTDGGSTFINMQDNITTSIILSNGSEESTSLIIPFTADKGDLIKPQIQSVTDASTDVTITDFSCYGLG